MSESMVTYTVEGSVATVVPRVPTELMRLRLAPTHLQRAAALAETFSPEEARAAGFIDELVSTEALRTRTHAKAAEPMELDMQAHAATKRRNAMGVEFVQQIFEVGVHLPPASPIACTAG